MRIKIASNRLKRAFTALDSTVTMSCVAVVISIGMPAPEDATERARQVKAETVVQNVATAKLRYFLDHSAEKFDQLPNDDARWDAVRGYLLLRNLHPAAGPEGKAEFAAGSGHESFTVGRSFENPTVP